MYSCVHLKFWCAYRVYIVLCACKCVCLYLHMHVYVHLYVYVCIYIHIYLYLHTYTSRIPDKNVEIVKSPLTTFAEVVVVGRTGGPKNKVLRAIVTRMRRASRLTHPESQEVPLLRRCWLHVPSCHSPSGLNKPCEVLWSVSLVGPRLICSPTVKSWPTEVCFLEPLLGPCHGSPRDPLRTRLSPSITASATPLTRIVAC